MPIPTPALSTLGRCDFGGTAADFTADSAGGLFRAKGGSLVFYSAQTGGTQYDDLIFNGVATNTITVPPSGQIPVFQGPAGVVVMWAEDGNESTERVAIVASVGVVQAGEAAVVDALAAATDAATQRQAAEAAKVAAQAVPATTDGQQAYNLATDGTQTKAALSAATAAQVAPVAAKTRLGTRWVFDGDSIAIGSVTTEPCGQTRNGSWTVDMAWRSHGRIDYVYNAAVAGTGIQQAVDRFATSVAPYAADVVCLSTGTNDVAIGGTLADYLADLTDYYALVRGVGAQLVLGAIYPKSTSAATIATWNTAILAWAQARNVIVIPFWELADTTTGAWPSGWSTDGTHPLRESPAFAALGKLAWQTVASSCSGPVAPTARFAGEGIHTNFFTDLIPAMTGHATFSSAATEVAGTLPAGLYTYRVAARTRYGKEASYSDQSITLNAPGGSTGGAQLSVGGTGTYDRRAVYRKGPGESAFRYIGQVTTLGAAQPFTDNGLSAQYDWADGDSSRVPTGLLNGATQDLHTLAYGAPIQTDPGIRGNFLRLTRQEGSANARVDYFAITGLTVGQVVTLTCKVRGPATTAATERLALRFRTTDNATQVAQGIALYERLGTDWTTIHVRFTVPSGSNQARISFEGDATSPYLDIAELRVA